MSGAISEAGGTLKRSDAFGDREDHVWMRRLSLHLRVDHGKAIDQRGVAPFCSVDCTKASWLTRPLIPLALSQVLRQRIPVIRLRLSLWIKLVRHRCRTSCNIGCLLKVHNRTISLSQGAVDDLARCIVVPMAGLSRKISSCP